VCVCLCILPGITPAITNEVGLYVTPDSYDIAKLPRQTRVNAHRVPAIRQRTGGNRSNNARARAGIAVPNDRQQSIRPGPRDQQYECVTMLIVIN